MELTYAEIDSMKAVQQELLQRIDDLSAQIEANQGSDTQSVADNTLALQEIRDQMEMLSYRIDENAQLIAQKSGGPVPVPIPVRADSSDTTSVDSLGTSPPSLDPSSEADNLYKGAYMDLTLGNYDLGVQGFKNYLVRYPDAKNADSARYYLGECYYGMSRYLEAVAEYQTVIREYSSSRYVPSSYLQSGFCYKELEEEQLSQRAFRELISKYPRSEEAEQARVELQETEG